MKDNTRTYIWMNTTALSACAVCRWLLLERKREMYISPTYVQAEPERVCMCTYAAAGAASYQPK